jgi:predicted MPP superfamily phosphohydrolase
MGYLFLFTVGLEVISAINRFFKLIPGHLVNNKISAKIGFYLVILGVSALIVHGHYNVVNPRVQTYDIQVAKRHTNLEKLKIVAAADFHLSNITGPHFLENIVEKINSLNPDLVLIAGDITIERSKVVDWKKYDEDFRKIKSRYGVYSIIGNHELQYYPEKTLQFIARSNMRLLQDSVVNIDDLFYILGRNDKSDIQRKSLEELIKSIKDDLPVIMIEHRVSEMEEVEDKKIDVHISGHTHAGQLFPANLLMELIYRLNWGYKKYRDTHFFVTSGVGTWGPPVRVGSYSEIMEINIIFN